MALERPKRRWAALLLPCALFASSAALEGQVREYHSDVETPTVAALIASGPELSFGPSAVEGWGLIKGGWPMALDFVLAKDGYLIVEVQNGR